MYKGKFDLIWSLADPVTQTDAQLPNYTAFDPHVNKEPHHSSLKSVK